MDDHGHHHDEPEDRSPSLAGRLLTYLVLLIAGAALALWGGPKLAPQLPAWAAPAAKFLTPGGDAALQEVTSLRTEVDSKLGALSAGPDADAIRAIAQAEIDAAVGASTTALQSEITALRDQLTASDSGEIEARLAQMETRVEGLSAELGTINDAVSKATLEGGSISEAALATLSANGGKIDGLRAELEAIAARNGALSQRIDDVEAAATRRVAEAEAELAASAEEAKSLAAQKAMQEQLTALANAATGGGPFEQELQAVAAIDGLAVPQNLTDAAAAGIKPVALLEAEFAPLAHEAIRVSIKSDASENGGTLSKISAFFESQVATRSLEPTEGDSVDAILSRMQAGLGTGALDTVLSEAEGLAPPAKSVLASWLNDVAARHAVLGALQSLGASAS